MIDEAKLRQRIMELQQFKASKAMQLNQVQQALDIIKADLFGLEGAIKEITNLLELEQKLVQEQQKEPQPIEKKSETS
jgi:t-SNARE complex subunit (syntaxin)